MLKKLEHIGVVVKDLQKVQKTYTDILGMKVSETERLPLAEVAFLPIGETNIELLEPVGTEGHLPRFLEHRGEGLHHICFRVEEIDRIVEGLIRQGIKMRDKVPRTGSRGSRVAFTEPDQFGGVLVEFCQLLKNP
jgi:methylmalonyl-CoA/ethylmalonyl-CoA epimerase